ncbi:MAG TPA: hypothetical protein VKE98_14700 [Gemmataceae bacterium]|nr:hypothetical protein [Gemmataceae bacterium]
MKLLAQLAKMKQQKQAKATGPGPRADPVVCCRRRAESWFS